ncbi:PLC-like phosphodiesterase [Phlyctochytrium arcticum]|nr:PLC-like phosphodiesterase [Phlyctochytrium arcticum]
MKASIFSFSATASFLVLANASFSAAAPPPRPFGSTTLQPTSTPATKATCPSPTKLPAPLPSGSKADRWNTCRGTPALVFAHRGEKTFSLPEHTLPAYHLAVWEHADYVEPDLTLTKDGEFVLFHDLAIGSGTDVKDHPEFAHLMRNTTIWDPSGNGGNITFTNDWLIHDFKLAELRTLRLTGGVGGGGDNTTSMRYPRFFDGIFQIPTLSEFFNLIADDTKRSGRVLGILPELKHPSWHNEVHGAGPHFMEDKFLKELESHGYKATGRGTEGSPKPVGSNVQCLGSSHLDPRWQIPAADSRGPVVVQSFEAESAKYLHSQRPDLPIVQLVYGNIELLTPKGLDEVASYATYISPWKEMYIVGAEEVYKAEMPGGPPDEVAKAVQQNGGLIPAAQLFNEARKRGILQVPFTLYSSYDHVAPADGATKDVPFPASETIPPPPSALSLDRRHELFYYMALGMDGLFTENVAEAITLREQFAERYIARQKHNGGDGQGREGVDGVVDYPFQKKSAKAQVARRQTQEEVVAARIPSDAPLDLAALRQDLIDTYAYRVANGGGRFRSRR